MIKEFQGQYKWLSNFAPVEIKFKDIIYSSVEHAYMSCKSNDPDWKLYCSSNISAGELKRESYKIELIKDWDKLKIHYMNHLLKIKFNQEPFKSLLIETGNVYIQEGNTWGDKFWGVDISKDPNVGQNYLGKLIMKIRKELNGDSFFS